MHLRFVAQLVDQLFTSATLPPPLRFGGSTTLSVFSRGVDVDAERGGRDRLERLLLRLHDVRQRRVARLVQAQVGGDDRGQLHRQRLEAAVDLALRPSRLPSAMSTFEANVACGQSSSAASIWPVWLAVVVDRLLAEDDELRLLLVDQRLQQLGHRERLQSSTSVSTRIARSAPSASAVRSVSWQRDAARHGDDLGGDALFLQPHRLLDGDLVERIHRHLHVGGLDAGVVGLDADLDVVVDHALDWHQDFRPVSTAERFIKARIERHPRDRYFRKVRLSTGLTGELLIHDPP